MTIVGVIKNKRTECPTVFMVSKDRRLFGNTFGLQRDVTIVSYGPKKNKIVTLLSTGHNDKGIESCGEN